MNQDPSRPERRPKSKIEHFFDWAMLILDGQLPSVEQMENGLQPGEQPAVMQTPEWQGRFAWQSGDAAERLIRLGALSPSILDVRLWYRRHLEGGPVIATEIRFDSPLTVHLFQPQDPGSSVIGIVTHGGTAKFYRPDNPGDPDELNAMYFSEHVPDPAGPTMRSPHERRFVSSPLVGTLNPADTEAALAAAFAHLDDPDPDSRSVVGPCKDYADAMTQVAAIAKATLLEKIVPALDDWAKQRGLMGFQAYLRTATPELGDNDI